MNLNLPVLRDTDPKWLAAAFSDTLVSTEPMADSGSKGA
jgi:hypothetical protein